MYVPFGGLYGDCSDYKGRVVGAPVSGSGPVVSFTTPNQRQAGIWAPAGESVRDGSLYVATGNGMPYNQVDDSDSVLRLSPGLAVQDRFTPANFAALSADDLDLGSTVPALLPDGLIFQIGKQGIGYVLDGSRARRNRQRAGLLGPVRGGLRRRRGGRQHGRVLLLH